jgi:hypothetical protein
MRTISFILFYSIVFTVYFLVNFYIFSRGWQAIPSDSRTRIFYLVGFIFLAVSFILGRTLERFVPGVFKQMFLSGQVPSGWLLCFTFFFWWFSLILSDWLIM